jgi:glycosyltransferase involved in cell wall biosynthesis
MIPETQVTVLMPVYNASEFLREAVDSILAQTFSDFEFVIVNDGSTDDSEIILNSYNDPRIRIIHQSNGGVSSALNTGLQHSRGKYVARFDADDICLPDRLQLQYEFITSHPEYVMVGSDADYVNEKGEFVFHYSSPGYTDEEIRTVIYGRNPFIHSALFFVKDVILSCGGYDINAHTFEDHLLWVKVITRGKVCNFRESLIRVRLNPASVTTDERLRGKRFLQLRKNILSRNEVVTPGEGAELMAIIKSQDSLRIRTLGYHLFIAKKYLWNNYRPVLARKHIFECIKQKPLHAYNYALLILSFLPRSIVSGIYKFAK